MNFKHTFLGVALATLLPLWAHGQETQKDHFALIAGYEYFPEMHKGDGYNVGIEYKHYMRHHFFMVANFHAGMNDGSRKSVYTGTGNREYNFDLCNSNRDFMLGIGLGYDFLHIKRHRMYAQATAGLGTSHVQKDGIVLAPGGSYDIKKQFEETSTRFAVSASAGYDYQLTDWLAIGVNYTGWQIGYEYKNSANVKLSFTF